MKFLYFAIPLAVVPGILSSVLQRNECNANNCARAITGTNARPAATIRQADCSSYMQTTFTPAATTITVTRTPLILHTTVTYTIICTVTAFPTFTGTTTCATVAETTVPSSSFDSVSYSITESTVTFTEKAVPTYASACTVSGTTDDYSSACSCWGITATTATLSGSTKFTTIISPPETITSTSTKFSITTVTATEALRRR